MIIPLAHFLYLLRIAASAKFLRIRTYVDPYAHLHAESFSLS